MRKKTILVTGILCSLLLTGCRQEQVPHFTETTDASFFTEPVTPSETVTPTTPAAASFSFSDLAHIRFLFASGAGGWGTVLYVQPDGSFSGNYYDSESSVGPDYPNGSVAYCDFTGKFAQPTPVDTYMYSLKIEELQYKFQPGTEEIRDGILYHYVSAHGLTGAEEMILYLPGAPVEALPSDYTQWFDYQLRETTQLPFYGLYNQANWYCFSGTDMVQEIRQRVAEVEKMDAEANTHLQNAATQADMNTAAYNRFLLWDDVLNELWRVLKQLLPAEEMRQLTNEELAWIESKEKAIADAGAEVEGGSLYPAVTNGTAAKLTQERVYELLEYLPDNT